MGIHRINIQIIRQQQFLFNINESLYLASLYKKLIKIIIIQIRVEIDEKLKDYVFTSLGAGTGRFFFLFVLLFPGI